MHDAQSGKHLVQLLENLRSLSAEERRQALPAMLSSLLQQMDRHTVGELHAETAQWNCPPPIAELIEGNLALKDILADEENSDGTQH